MRYPIKTVVPVLAATLLLGGSLILATPELGEDTSLKCTSCHDKAGSKLLTDKGKYFETMRSLDGFDELAESFGRCTNCHVRRPGSAKLTRTGKRLAAVVDDMSELRTWLDEKHPMPPAAKDE